MTTASTPPPSHAPSPENWSDQLSSLLARQHDVCCQLQSCRQRQADLLSGERAEELLELLDERQELIDELTGLSDQLESYRAAWPRMLAQLSPGQGDRLQALVTAVQNLVDEIVNGDREDCATLAEEQGRIRDDLGTLNSGRSTNRAYTATRGSGTRTNRFMDQQG